MGAKEKVLEYLKQHLNKWIHNQELRKISMANDTPRIIRALRQEGWKIEVRGDGYNRLTSLEQKDARGERKTISRKMRYEVFNRDSFKCRACGRDVTDGTKLEVDHIIPIDWGGKTELSNLQALCRECNAGKKAWMSGHQPEKMQKIMSNPTVESRIEALFDTFPNEDIPSEMVRLVSKGALDWQRALRRIRQRTGKKILPMEGRNGYHYFKN
ncbi:MAG: hypothetical protein DDT18_01647 [Actinobacteria bacterium]|nr:hypothetical protein [Actinomycetota bacterium]GFP41575.1 hypothetical protein HKBW3C_00700 [Candidatus Hakubella thermalkaliphila]